MLFTIVSVIAGLFLLSACLFVIRKILHWVVIPIALGLAVFYVIIACAVFVLTQIVKCG